MSDDTNRTEEDHPTNEDGLKVVGTDDDVTRFSEGDLVQVHLEMKGQVFLTYPHEERGMVVALSHQDDEYFYHMPVVQFEKELRMFNPDHLIVVQKFDETRPEAKRLDEARVASDAEREKQEKEGKDEA